MYKQYYPWFLTVALIEMPPVLNFFGEIALPIAAGNAFRI
jgi:hypothetical protein